MLTGTSFIHQRSTWGYLQISLETFERLLIAHSVTFVVIDAVHAFGAKVTGEDDPLFNICHYDMYSSKVDNGEVCGGPVSGKLMAQASEGKSFS